MGQLRVHESQAYDGLQLAQVGCVLQVEDRRLPVPLLVLLAEAAGLVVAHHGQMDLPQMAGGPGCLQVEATAQGPPTSRGSSGLVQRGHHHTFPKMDFPIFFSRSRALSLCTSRATAEGLGRWRREELKRFHFSTQTWGGPSTYKPEKREARDGRTLPTTKASLAS